MFIAFCMQTKANIEFIAFCSQMMSLFIAFCMQYDVNFYFIHTKCNKPWHHLQKQKKNKNTDSWGKHAKYTK